MRSNLFDGDSAYAAFAQTAYAKLMSRKWVTYTDVMKSSMGERNAAKMNLVSNCDSYGELKKAFPDVCRAIREKAGEESIEIDGNIRNRRFRYVGVSNDPLADMRNAKVVNDLKKYWQFCQDSAGFFPESWLEYFFKDCKDLLDIKAKKRKGERALSSSLDRTLTNIELLPFLYEAIIHKEVLNIEYKPYNKEAKTLLFHPHHLKEFNGRWHLLGHAEGELPELGYNIALDRIIGRPKREISSTFISAPEGHYTHFFKDIIGVSHLPYRKATTIRLRAHEFNVFKLTDTKPIHHSQVVTLPFGEYDDGSYGEFELYVEVNNEFKGRILQMGEGFEIISPESLRIELREKIEKLYNLYR